MRGSSGSPSHACAPEVLCGGGQDLVAAQLALGVADLEDVAQQRGVALGVGQLVRIHVADRADDGLGQRVIVQLQALEPGCGAIIHLHLHAARLSQPLRPCWPLEEQTCPQSQASIGALLRDISSQA